VLRFEGTNCQHDVIQGDEQSRDGHYRAKQELREQGVNLPADLDPNDSTHHFDSHGFRRALHISKADIELLCHETSPWLEEKT